MYKVTSDNESNKGSQKQTQTAEVQAVLYLALHTGFYKTYRCVASWDLAWADFWSVDYENLLPKTLDVKRIGHTFTASSSFMVSTF